MRNKQLLSLALGLIILGGACKKDDYRNNQLETDGEVKFTSSIGGNVGTRVTGNAWDANDEIGVFMKQGASLSGALAVNKKYTTTGNGNFEGAGDQKIYFPETGNVDFIAYYPYKADLTGVSLPISVADQTKPAAIDVLYADNAKGLNKETPLSNLLFKHKLTKVEFTVAAGAGVASLDDLKVAINGVHTEASLNLETGVVSGAKEVKDVTALVNKAGANRLAEAILISGDYGAKEVVFTAEGKTYKWAVPSATKYEEGKKHTYTIRLSTTETGNEVEVVGTATITDWVNTPGGSHTLNPDGNGEGDGEGPGPNPGVTEVFYFEDFGDAGPTSGTRARVEQYNAYKESSVIYKDFDPANYADIRATSSMNTHVWFSANRTTGLVIENIKSAGHTKLKLTYDLAANGAGELFSGLSVKVNGVDVTPKTGALNSQNEFVNISIDNVADSESLKIEFVANASNNTKGYRLDNVRVEGTTK